MIAHPTIKIYIVVILLCFPMDQSGKYFGNLGFGHVFITHQVDSIELFKMNITQRLHDQYRLTLGAAIVQM